MFVAAGGWNAFSSTKFGIAAEQALSFQVVLANGSIVVANDSSHTDLFWALRGAGHQSFGVVTEMTFKLHPARRTPWLVLWWEDPSVFRSVMKRWAVASADFAADTRLAFGWQATYALRFMLQFDGSWSEFDALLAPFLSATPLPLRVERFDFTINEFFVQQVFPTIPEVFPFQVKPVHTLALRCFKYLGVASAATC